MAKSTLLKDIKEIRINQKNRGKYCTPNNTLLEIYNDSKHSHKYIKEFYYEERRKVAKNWLLALKEIIKEVKEILSLNENGKPKNPIEYYSYNYILQGKNVQAVDVFRDSNVYPIDNKGNYPSDIITYAGNNVTMLWGDVYINIAIGVELTELLPLMEKEVIQLDNSSINIKISKVKWNGTPGEFGAIMNELIDKGFIHQIKDLKNTVNFLSEIFEVRNDKGKIVDPQYLYKCFTEKKKSFFAHEFKIPLSDNNKIK